MSVLMWLNTEFHTHLHMSIEWEGVHINKIPHDAWLPCSVWLAYIDSTFLYDMRKLLMLPKLQFLKYKQLVYFVWWPMLKFYILHTIYEDNSLLRKSYKFFILKKTCITEFLHNPPFAIKNGSHKAFFFQLWSVTGHIQGNFDVASV